MSTNEKSGEGMPYQLVWHILSNCTYQLLGEIPNLCK